MTKKKKIKRSKKSIKPDQVEYFGPLSVARFGKAVVMRNLMDEKKHFEFIKHAAKEYPNICKEIDQHVYRIRDLAQLFDPLTLLQCGYFNFVRTTLGKPSELQYSGDDVIILRMIDYIQSVIVSSPPTKKGPTDFNQEKWDKLYSEVRELYYKLNFAFHIAHTAVLKSLDKHYDDKYDAFYVKAQILWANVRGHRYMLHDLPHLHDLLSPHGDIFKELFNITIDDFIQGLRRLQDSLSEGLQKVTLEMKEFRQKTSDLIDGKITADTSEADLPELMQDVVREQGWQDWQTSIIGRFVKFDLFDVEKVTGFPGQLLKELAWSPGQDKDLFAPGEFSGWPLRVLPIQVRPFLCVDGRYYCFELLNLMDNLYRIIQRMIFRLRPEYKETWNERQKTISENLPFRLFERLLQNSKTYRSVYYRRPIGESNELKWCETDGLIIFDDHLLIVEVKAGAFTYTPPTTDFPAYMASIKALLLKPALQAKRFLEYLQSKDEIEIFDDKHNQITTLRHDQFRHITACCVTIDSFTTLAAQAESLKPIGADLKDFPVWSVSVDDLRVYADIFDSSLMFTHFLEERQRAFKSPALEVEDELDHLCLYLKHNRYVTYAEELYQSSPVKWHGYRLALDKYFHKARIAPGTEKKPTQPLPLRITEIIKIMERKGRGGRCQAARYLLDMDGGTRKDFNESLEQLLSKQSAKNRIMPLSLSGEKKLTVFCQQEGIPSPGDQWKRDYVLAILFRSKDNERMMLNLSFDKNNKINDADFEFLCLDDIPANRYAEIKTLSAEQGKRLIQSYLKQSGRKKIGRNEICPCGSGRKYKQCCGRQAI